MASEAIASYLKIKISELVNIEGDKLNAIMNDYLEINILLQMAGHNPTEFQEAYSNAMGSIEKLRDARDKACKKFADEGVLYEVVSHVNSVDS